jgi:release factor glutamine methyltransferase
MPSEGSLLDLLQRGADYLAKHDIDNARREAEWIFAEGLGLSRLELYTRFDMPVAEPERLMLRERIQRRGQREPLAYVLGTQPFCGLDLTVGPDVLVPRPETEELVELVSADLAQAGAGDRILDVGTGSGAIALALCQRHSVCEVHATDLSAAALEVARANAERHQLTLTFHKGHLATELPGDWRMVVANLPYIGDNERQLCDPELDYEPQQALFAPDEGMALVRELIADAPRLLGAAGVLWLEHGFAQAERVAACCAEHGLQCRHEADGAGHLRFTRAWSDG